MKQFLLISAIIGLAACSTGNSERWSSWWPWSEKATYTAPVEHVAPPPPPHVYQNKYKQPSVAQSTTKKHACTSDICRAMCATGNPDRKAWCDKYDTPK